MNIWKMVTQYIYGWIWKRQIYSDSRDESHLTISLPQAPTILNRLDQRRVPILPDPSSFEAAPRIVFREPASASGVLTLCLK